MSGQRELLCRSFARRMTTLLLLMALALTGCAQKAREQADKDQEAANQKAAAPAPMSLQQNIDLARVYLKHQEFDKAETLLEKAILESGAHDKVQAIKLLDQIKAAKARHLAAKEAADAVTADDTEVAAEESGDDGESMGDGSAGEESSMEAEVAATDAADAQAGDIRADDDPNNFLKNGDNAAKAKEAQPDAPAGEKQPAADNGPKQAKKESSKAGPVIKADGTITAKEVSALETAAKKAATAKDALAMYDAFLKAAKPSRKQKDILQTRRDVWKDRADRDFVRLGKKWVTAKEVKQASEDADRLIRQAVELILIENYKGAGDFLRKASAADPNGIRADFALGLFSSLFDYNAAVAEKHFREVLDRVDDHGAALNNLALSEVKQRNFASAYIHWRKATTLSPDTPEVTHNLGRLISEASQKRLRVDPELLNDFSDLYSSMTVAGKGTRLVSGTGWLYSPLVLPKDERLREEKSAKGPDDNSRLVMTGGGSGFVVQNKYVLTNRHVVQSGTFGLADAVKLIDPSDPAHLRELDAEIVAVAKDCDLALLKCENLNAPSVELSANLPRRGSEVLILGYPELFEFGRNLKTTKGIVTALPDVAHDNMLLFDAEATHGNSGGPICDNTGDVLAVLTRHFPKVGVFYTGGVTSVSALDFVRKHVPEVRPAVKKQAVLNWPDVDEKVSKSTVMVLVKHKEFAMGMDRRVAQTKKAKPRNYLEDMSCSLCNGTSLAYCPNCRRGVISEQEQYQIVVGDGSVNRVRIGFAPSNTSA